MPVTDLLRRNAREHGDEVALIELNPAMEDTRKISFKEFDLVQQTKSMPYRHEITWQIFDEKSNRVANMLLGRGIKKGDKVAILMFNCLEWLPIYFGILKTGAIAVPFNFRYTANEISYCADLAEISVMFFGSEFVDRLNINADEIAKDRLLLYVGDGQALSTSHPVRQDSPRQSFTLTEALHRQLRWKPFITRQARTTASSASRLSITRVQSSTGWVLCGHAAEQFF